MLFLLLLPFASLPLPSFPSLPFPSILCSPACHNYLHFTSSSNLALSSFFSPFWALAAQAQGSRVSASSPASSHVIISNQGQQRPVDVVIIVAASGFSSVSGSGSVAAALFVFVVSSCKLPLKVLKCCTWFVIKTLQRGGSSRSVGGRGRGTTFYILIIFILNYARCGFYVCGLHGTQITQR